MSLSHATPQCKLIEKLNLGYLHLDRYISPDTWLHHKVKLYLQMQAFSSWTFGSILWLFCWIILLFSGLDSGNCLCYISNSPGQDQKIRTVKSHRVEMSTVSVKHIPKAVWFNKEWWYRSNNLQLGRFLFFTWQITIYGEQHARLYAKSCQ